MISGHGCIRLHKMAFPLIERGHNVHLLAQKVCPFHQQYKTFSLCTDVEQMLESMRLYANNPDIDVFHCHNEPSWYVTALKEMTDKPVILDVHDSFLARSTPEESDEAKNNGEIHLRVLVEERNNFQLADALVFPGEHFRAVITGEYKLSQPALTLPSYVPKRFYQYKGKDWYGGLVYEGKVTLPKDSAGAHKHFSYCDYADLAERANAIGMDFHLYGGSSSKEMHEAYPFDHTFIHRGMVFEELLSSITRHDWGLVGNSIPHREWSVAMPNKMFEYMAAGIPIVAMNADNCAEFLEETGTGISVESVEELGDRWKEHTEVRKNLLKVRQQWSMNAHIHKLESFYEGVMNERA